MKLEFTLTVIYLNPSLTLNMILVISRHSKHWQRADILIESQYYYKNKNAFILNGQCFGTIHARKPSLFWRAWLSALVFFSIFFNTNRLSGWDYTIPLKIVCSLVLLQRNNLVACQFTKTQIPMWLTSHYTPNSIIRKFCEGYGGWIYEGKYSPEITLIRQALMDHW